MDVGLEEDGHFQNTPKDSTLVVLSRAAPCKMGGGEKSRVGSWWGQVTKEPHLRQSECYEGDVDHSNRRAEIQQNTSVSTREVDKWHYHLDQCQAREFSVIMELFSLWYPLSNTTACSYLWLQSPENVVHAPEELNL